MSTLVTQIRTGINTIITANLSTYSTMPFVFDPEKNDFRRVEKSYGIVALGAATNSENGVLKTYTLDHEFQILLARRFVKRDNDDNALTVIDDLYDQADTLFVKMLGTKLTLPLIVMTVHSPSMSEPEILENSAALLRLGFTVEYRNTLDP